MIEDKVRQRPLDAAPVLSDRATAQRRGRTGSAAMVAVAAVAGVAVVGALLSNPAQERHLKNVAVHPNGRIATPAVPSNGQPVTARPSGQVTASASAGPAVSQAYATASPGPDTPFPTDLPPRDAQLPPSGTCPTSVDPMRLPVHNPWDASTWPQQVSAVTLCRYEHSTFDTSEGHNTLTRGPVTGDLAVFAVALDKALPPVRPIDHVGCRIVNPGPPYTLDVVFVTASRDSGKAYIMLRTLCDPPWRENPERALTGAVDSVLGPPY